MSIINCHHFDTAPLQLKHTRKRKPFTLLPVYKVFVIPMNKAYVLVLTINQIIVYLYLFYK